MLRPVLQMRRFESGLRRLVSELRRLRAVSEFVLGVPCRGPREHRPGLRLRTRRSVLASGIHDPLEREAGHKSCGLHTQLENTGPAPDRPVKIFVEAHGCTQNYGEGRLMAEALAGAA